MGSVFMRKKPKINSETKLSAIRAYLDGEGSCDSIANEFNISRAYLQSLVARFVANGPESILTKNKNQTYSTEFKEKVVLEYLEGKTSLNDLVIKYGMRSLCQIHNWIRLYNGGKNLKSTRTKGVATMTKGRKTTLEERLEIVEHCLKNGLDYQLSAEVYKVSYQQVYSWIRKYNSQGTAGLKDNRGKGKDREDMNEVELLAAENKLLKARLERFEIEAELKKKVHELQMDLATKPKKKK